MRLKMYLPFRTAVLTPYDPRLACPPFVLNSPPAGGSVLLLFSPSPSVFPADYFSAKDWRAFLNPLIATIIFSFFL